MSFDSAKKGKEVKEYFNTKDFSIVVSCELKWFKLPVVSKIEGYFLVYRLSIISSISWIHMGSFFESK